MAKLLKVGDTIKQLALFFILLGSFIILKYMLKPKQHKTQQNQQFNNQNGEIDNEIEQNQQDKLSDVFVNKGNIFFMICLFLMFIIIVILIALRRFF